QAEQRDAHQLRRRDRGGHSDRHCPARCNVARAFMTKAGTRFAILQRSLEIPDVEKLKRAFRSVKGLTETDAHTLAKDAFGVLVNNLSATDAMTLRRVGGGRR